MSWNVNGIRAALRNGFLQTLKKYQPDILALQEVKISTKDRSKAELDFPGYAEFWNSAERPGYAGTAILIKESLPLKVLKQINDTRTKKFDSEGRVQTIEFPQFYFINTYFPHSRHDLSRLNFKIEFNNKIFAHVKKLEKKKPVIITGDFNVAHEAIDLANPKTNEGNPGFHPKERKFFDQFLKKDMTDAYRALYPKKIQYTWWSYRFTARERNIGWRIDYFIVSKKLFKKVKEVKILDQVKGSDHCPILLKIEL